VVEKINLISTPYMQLHHISLALHCAASKGHTACITALVRKGAKIDSVDHNGCTPLFYAIKLDKLESVRELLLRKPNPTQQDLTGRRLGYSFAIMFFSAVVIWIFRSSRRQEEKQKKLNKAMSKKYS